MKLKQFLAAALMLVGVGAWAQTDVTSTYLTNADFSSTDGWTQDHSSQYWSLGNGRIGTYAVANSKTSSTDATHLSSEYCFGIQCRWQTNYAAFTQTTALLPVGAYTLSFDVQNKNTSTTNATYANRFTVTVGGTTYTDSKKEWMSGSSAWTTHTITFNVTEAAAATISLGYGTGSNNFGTGSTPHLYVSHLSLTWTDPNAAANAAKLAAAKYTLNGYIKKATALNGVLGTLASAIEEAQGVYDSATDYATHYNGVVSASATLNSAITEALSGLTVVTLTNANFDTTPNNTLNEGATVYGGTLSTATSNPDNTKDFSANTGDHAYLYEVTGWTQYSKFNSTASQGTTSEYGTAMPANGWSTNSTTIPETDMFGASNGAALHLSAGWGDQARYQQTIADLPSGRYVMYYEVINQHSNTGIASNYIGVNGAAGDFYGTSNAYVYSGLNSIEQGVWKAQAFEFDVAKTADINFSVGVTTSNGGSGNGAKLWIDNILVYRIGDIVVADADAEAILAEVATLDEAVYNATAKSDLATAKSTFESNKSIDNYNALNAALIAAKASRDAYVLLNAAITKVEGWTATAATESIRAKYTNGEYANETAADIFAEYQAAEIAAIVAAEGSDFTSVILNQSFETGDMTGWSAEGRSDTGVKANSNGTYTINNDVDGDYIFNSWGGTAENNVYQTIANLPAGTYQLSALLAGFTGEELVLAANETTNSVVVAGDKTTGNTVNVVFTLAEAGNVTIKASNTKATSADASFIKADNFRLVAYNDPLAPYKEQLTEKKAEAEQALANDDYANVTGSERSALTAKAAVTPDETEVAYNTAVSELTAAISTFTAAKAAYDGLAALWNAGVPELIYAATEKYTAIGDAYFGEGDVVDAADAEARTAAMKTAIRAYYESHALAEKVEEAVNCADAIAGADPEVNTGWTGGIGTDNRSWEMYTDASGNAGGRYYDGGWSTSAGVNINMSRSISLPAGTYLLTVTARGSENLTSYTMSVGGESVDLPGNGSGENVGVFGHGWDDASVEFTTDGTPVTLTITANSEATQQWISFNRFRLVRLELNTDVYAGADDYAALNTAIEKAEAKTLGFEDGQYAPYVNASALETLATAKAIDQTAELTNLKTDVEAATTALNDATWTANDGDVDAIYNGTFAEADGWNPKGWTRSNNGWGQQITGLTAETNGVAEGTTTAWYYNNNGAWQYGNGGIYTMPLAANQAYELSFKYRKNGNDWQNWMKASVTNINNEGLEVAQFSAAENGTNFVEAKAYFTTGAAGNYILSIEQNGNAHLTDVSLVKAASAELTLNENDDNELRNRTYYEVVNVTRTVKEGFNTVVLPFDLTAEQVAAAFGDDTKVYTFSEEGEADAEYLTVNFTEGDGSISANVPVLVKATKASTEQVFNGVQIVAPTNAAWVEGTNANFVGVFGPTTVGEGHFFIGNGAIYKSAGNTNIKAFRAYILLNNPNTTAGVKMFIGGIETGIEEINGLSPNPSPVSEGSVFNLAGQRVNKAQKGIYIVNGKKVLVK